MYVFQNMYCTVHVLKAEMTLSLFVYYFQLMEW